MKKKTTTVAQPDKTEAMQPLMQSIQPQMQKMYRNHSHCDHSHGRVNKFPFGSSHGPWSF